MTQLPPHYTDDPEALDSERLLRAFGVWRPEYEQRTEVLPPPADFVQHVACAYRAFMKGLTPTQVRLELAEKHPECRSPQKAIQGALRAIQADEEGSREHRARLVAIQRQTAIQGAIQDRAWGAVRGLLADAGAVAGELDPELSLSRDDLRLIVEIEGDPLLEAGQGEAMPEQ